MGAISADFVWRSEAQLQSKQLWMETDDPTTSVIPPSSSTPSASAPSSSAAGVTLEAIMAQLQWMDTCLDYLTEEMCQMNTQVGCIARWQARMAGFAPFPSPSPEASTDEDDDAGADEDVASSSIDDEMTTSQWLTLCHSWQKGEVILV